MKMKEVKNKKLGQSLIEYVALTALVAVVSIGSVRLFGSKIRQRLEQVSTKFDATLKVGYKSPKNSNQNPDDPDDGSDPDSGSSGGSHSLPGVRIPGL